MKALQFLKTHGQRLLTLIALLGFAIYSLLGHVQDAKGFATMLAIALSTLLAIQVAQAFDIPERFAESKRDLQKTLLETLTNLDKYGTHLVPFEDKENFNELFEGLSGEVRSYNPHPFGEHATAIDEKTGIKIMRERLLDPLFTKAVYIVCTGDDYGKEQFAKLMRRLFHACKDAGGRKVSLQTLESKVHVKISPRKNFLSEPTYHLQHKRQNDRAVAELQFVPGTREPRFYLVSHLDSFRNLLSDTFKSELPVTHDVDLKKIFAELEQPGHAADSEIEIVIEMLHDGLV